MKEQSFKSRILQLLNIVLILSLFFFLIYRIYAQSINRPSPSGILVDAGGHLMHLNIMGKGTPVVVFENGSADFSMIWGLVQPEVAKFTTTVSFDRAGYAWSEPGPYPRTYRQMEAELHTALKNAGIKGPYIFVGQSFGGFLARAFARYYPMEVAGMVLVDALNEDSKIIMNKKAYRIRDWATGRPYPPVQMNFKKKRVNMPDTINKIVPDTTLEPELYKLPQDFQNDWKWAQSQPGYLVTVDSEMTWSPEELALMYKNKGKPDFMLGSIPLIVIARGDGGYEGLTDSAQLEEERIKLQHDLAGLSTDGNLIFDKNTGHNIHLDDPSTVINAIGKVTREIRNEKYLRTVK